MNNLSIIQSVKRINTCAKKDAISTALHSVCTDLENKHSYIRMFLVKQLSIQYNLTHEAYWKSTHSGL